MAFLRAVKINLIVFFAVKMRKRKSVRISVITQGERTPRFSFFKISLHSASDICCLNLLIGLNIENIISEIKIIVTSRIYIQFTQSNYIFYFFTVIVKA